MKELYLDIMEKAIDAYTLDEIMEYIDSVRSKGISEHGFPRLTANIGILLSNGRKKELAFIFKEMMDLCTTLIPGAKQRYSSAGNDFSVKEIVLAILEIEKNSLYPREVIEKWKDDLRSIDPYLCYSAIVSYPIKRIGNWAAYNAASEQVRKYGGIGDESDFIDLQIESQVMYFDDSGLYKDPGEPMLYDIATRLQLSCALFFGYKGKFADRLNELLEKGGINTLYMESVNGEIPYGGRSNQFLFNEAILASVLEFEADRHYKKGNVEKASEFKGAAALAANRLLDYLNDKDVFHIKNKYPSDSKFGCEGYGYFSKYMATVASFIYLGYIFANDDIPLGESVTEKGGYVHTTSPAFHKTFLNNGEYFVEYDTKADTNYDASGIGRIHKKGAPSAICLSVPFAQKPKYNIGDPNPGALAIAWGEGNTYTLIKSIQGSEPEVIWEVTNPKGETLTERCKLTNEGVLISLSGKGEKYFTLPVFKYDGKYSTIINSGEQFVTVTYMGWECTYSTDGAISATEEEYKNRNGNYYLYRAETREDILNIKVKIKRVD